MQVLGDYHAYSLSKESFTNNLFDNFDICSGPEYKYKAESFTDIPESPRYVPKNVTRKSDILKRRQRPLSILFTRHGYCWTLSDAPGNRSGSNKSRGGEKISVIFENRGHSSFSRAFYYRREGTSHFLATFKPPIKGLSPLNFYKGCRVAEFSRYLCI